MLHIKKNKEMWRIVMDFTCVLCTLKRLSYAHDTTQVCFIQQQETSDKDAIQAGVILKTNVNQCIT